MKEILKYIQLYTGCNDHALKRIAAILEPKLNNTPTIIERVVHVEKFVRKGLAPAVPLQEWASNYYKAKNTSYEEISNKTRRTNVVINRNRFLVEAYKEGYTASELGRYLKMCHASILHGLHYSKKK